MNINLNLMRCRRSTIQRRRALPLACLLALSGYAGVAGATTIYVDTNVQKISTAGGCSLQEAIWAANLEDNQAVVANADGIVDLIDTQCVLEDDGMAGYTIVLPGDTTFQMTNVVGDPFNYMGPTATPIVLADITIEANGALIEHAPNGVPFRAFAVGVESFATDVPLVGSGSLTIRNAHIRGFAIKGGDGAYGGGGGLGAGGAIYVHGGSLTVESSTFEGNSVTGGNGSRNVLNTGGGGGGGLAGNGGRSGLPPQETGHSAGGGGGGGGGARGNGGVGDSDCGSPCLGLGAAAGGGGGTLGSGEDGGGINQSVGGFRCGGDGGHINIDPVSGDPLSVQHDGENGTCPGGGGGGGRDSFFGFVEFNGGNGGEGNYGGGGGGGAGLLTFGDGAHGGFGGGGGAGGASSNGIVGVCSPNGGDGGFGSGGGAAAGGDACPFDTGGGRAGSFAGHAGSRDGGGGAGLGGAIFNHSGHVLVTNSTFAANAAARGVAGNWPNNQPESHSGQDQGAAIFSVGGSLRVLNSTIYGNEGTSSINGGAGIVVYAPGFDIFSPTPQVPPTSFELRNTIIAGNAAGSVVTKECRIINSEDNSVQFQGSGNLITANDNCTSGVVSSDDPLLASLQVNPPGLTPTMALVAGSPAIDAADPATALSTDQRGVGRPIGSGPDIGAYEWGSVDARCKDVTVSAGANCMADASVDDGSLAPDGGNFVLTQSPAGPYPLGMTLVTLTALHETGVSDSCQATVMVVDDTAPVVSATTSVQVLSAMRRHDLVNVGLSTAATDECSTPPTQFQIRVYGDEDDETPTQVTDDGATVFSPDATNLATNNLRLRAERVDTSDGRVYLVVASGSDSSGNTGYGCTTVVVPHNSSPGSLAQVISQAADAKAHCEANAGAPPAGYHVIGDGPTIGPKPKN